MFKLLSNICASARSVKFLSILISHGRIFSPKFRVSSYAKSTMKETPTSNNDVEHLKPPIKSPKDEKEYSVIKLKNGLTALLISDAANLISLENQKSQSENSKNELSPCASVDSEDDKSSESDEDDDSTEKFAALALTIAVGSFSDPKEIPGLAHFLEHMIFMGSAKYPAENAFDAFLTTKGGFNNASTDCEETTFYFECQEAHLEEAMDIFSQFFISPLLKREAMTREREAVDSEFQISLPKDYHRQQQFIGSLAAAGNPASNFMWGNTKTLKDDVTDDFLHSATVEFWKRHYSAHRMTIAVQARLLLSTLENWVNKYFSPIPSNNLPPDSFPLTGSPFNPEKFHKFYTLSSNSDETVVDIVWSLPSQISFYKEKPLDYLSWIIGHEGKNSYTAFLRSKFWAYDLQAGVEGDEFSDNSLFCNFCISVSLTDAGIEALNDVIAAAFSYVKLVRDLKPCERIYHEMKSLADIHFRFQEEEEVTDFVQTLSQNMRIFPSEEYITASQLFQKYNPSLISSYLDQMTPENALIIVRSKTLAKTKVLDKEEFWFKTKYRVDEITTELLAHFNNYKLPDFVALPPPNDFIPTEFDVLPPGLNCKQFPIKISSNYENHIDLWYKQDTKFKMPVTMMGFFFISNFSESSVKNRVLLDLCMKCLEQILVPFVYPANMAGFSTSIYTQPKGFCLEVAGFNQKLLRVLELILKKMISLPHDLSPELFGIMKNELTKKYRNALKDSKNIEKEVRLSILTNGTILNVSKSNELMNVEFNDLVAFTEEYLKKLRIECLLQGNLSESDATKICDSLYSTLQFEGLSFDEIFINEAKMLPLGTSLCKVKSLDVHNSNCYTNEYYQHGLLDLRSRCIVQFFITLLAEPLFDTIRTKEQLGYNVSTDHHVLLGVLGNTVKLESPLDKFKPQFAKEKLASFVQNFDKELKSISEETFKEAQESMIKEKLRAFNCLKEEVKVNFGEIKSLYFAFDKFVKEAKITKGLTLNDIIKWYEDHIKVDAPKLRKLVVQVVGYESNVEVGENSIDDKNIPLKLTYIVDSDPSDSSKIISDPQKFKSSLQSYPRRKITLNP